MLFWLVPFAVAGVFGVVFLANLQHILWVIYWSSDYDSGFTIPTTIAATGTGGHTILGTSGAWVTLWFGLLTAKLPLHRVLWEFSAMGAFVLAAVAVAWSVTQVANRRAGVLAALLILVAPPRALYFFMAPVAHNVVYPGTALLGAYLVWLAKSEERRPRTVWTVAVLAGILLGTCIASDPLLIATGLAPFAITGALAGLRWDSHSKLVAASALATASIAVPVAKLTSSTMGSLGYVTLTPGTAIAPLSSLPRHAELMLEGLRALMNGYLREATSSFPGSQLGLLCEILTAIALGAILVVGVLTTVRFAARALRRQQRSTPEFARSLHVIFWVGSAGSTSVAWALSDRIEYVHESYYATLVFSVAAVVVLLASSRSPARWLLSVGASIYFAASIVGIAGNYMESYTLPIARSYQHTQFVIPLAHYEAQVVSFAESHHVVVGYAGYGDSSTLTWNSEERLQARPVQLCGTNQGIAMCPFFDEHVPSWYKPGAGPSFVLVDTTEAFLPTLPEHLGTPVASANFGPIQMYVYPYDVAAAMPPAAN